MDVYRATVDFNPPIDTSEPIISLLYGELIEVLEAESRRSHREWWGIRRLYDDVLGYVPAKYLKRDGRVRTGDLPKNYLEQRSINVDRLRDLNHHTDATLPDIYSLPPVDVQSFDAWKDGEIEDGPLPDYSSGSDDDGDILDEMMRNNQKQDEMLAKSTGTLALSEWQQILADADDLPPPPPEAEFPPPDYGDDLSSPPHYHNARPVHTHTHSSQLDSTQHTRTHSNGDEVDDDYDNHLSPSHHHQSQGHHKGHHQHHHQDHTTREEPVVIRPSDAHANVKPSGLIEPKKLINPVLESKDRQDLHRELMFNYRRGIDPRHQKTTELERELRRRKEEQKKREAEEYQKSKRTPFEKKLMEQADKIKNYEQRSQRSLEEENGDPGSEFLRVHSKISKSKSNEPR